jgi:ATP synthase F1 delta subunit
MNEKKELLALRYAQAFLNVNCKEYNFRDFFVIQNGAEFFKNYKKACFYMRLSLLDKKVKEEALHLLCYKLNLPEYYKKLFSLLIEQNRVFLLPLIFRHLVQEYQKRALYMPTIITSTLPLEEDEKQKLLRFLSNITHTIILPTYIVDQNLIAGIRVMSGSYLFENSIAGKLRHVFKSLQ